MRRRLGSCVLGLAGLCALTLVALPAWAKWEKLAENGQVILRINGQFIVKDGKYRRTIEMQDLKARDPDGVLSRSYNNEYDCERYYNRISNVKSYAGPGLTGRLLFDVKEEGPWQKIPPGSLFAVGYIAVCVD